MEYQTRSIKVVLNDEEYRFIAKLAEHDGISFYEELMTVFRIGLDYCMSLPSYKNILKKS